MTVRPLAGVFTFLLSLSTVVGVNPIMAATPVAAQATQQPIMVGDNTVSVTRGGENWVNVVWTAPSRMENFRMTVQEWQSDTEVGYSNGEDVAYLSQDRNLEAGEMDIASFQLTTTADTPASFFIQVVAEWEFEGETFSYYPGGLNVQVVDDDGGDFLLLTKGATVSSFGSGSSNWIELDFLGIATLTTDIAVTVEGDLDIYYPQDSFTSLHHNSLLSEQERDVARIWIDPATVDPGTHDVMVVVKSVDAAGQAQTNSYPFTIEIQ